MAGDLGGRKQQNAYSTQNLANTACTRRTEGLFLLFYPSCTDNEPLFPPPPPPFCPNNTPESHILVVNDSDEGLHPTNAPSIGGGGF